MTIISTMAWGLATLAWPQILVRFMAINKISNIRHPILSVYELLPAFIISCLVIL